MYKNLYCVTMQKIIDKAKGLGFVLQAWEGFCGFGPFSGGYQHDRLKRIVSSQRTMESLVQF